jgi:uncharacterized protein (DUF1697 family)
VPSYVALLRGINVGGKNLIRMPELKACFEAAGFEDVATYIQSGNVLFAAPRAGGASLAARVDEALEATFGLPLVVVVRSRAQMRAVVRDAPAGFGEDPAAYRYDVIFLKEPLAAAAAAKVVSTKPEVDEVHPGKGVLYFSRLASRASQSHLSRVVSMPIYQRMTIRNWNTTTAILRLMDARA